MCAWLQEQVTYLKKEMENKESKEKDVANMFHHKTAETVGLKTELSVRFAILKNVHSGIVTGLVYEEGIGTCQSIVAVFGIACFEIQGRSTC